MRRQKTWRVRVVRKVEEWVSVSADTPLQAETIAASMPMVLSVFGGSAMRGDKPIEGMTPPLTASIEDDEE